MSAEPKLVTPQEAQGWVDVDAFEHPPTFWPNRLAHTVATEPDRTRAAVVRALRWAAFDDQDETNRQVILACADATENGADW